MFQLVFILVSVFGVLYFSVAKRQFDFFTIGFFSACIYFMPGYFGFTLYPPGSNFPRLPVMLLDETYMVMIALLVVILMGAFLFDFIPKKAEINLPLKGGKYFVHVAIGLAIIGCLATIILSGHQLLSTNKREMMESLSRWHILWVMSASIGAVVAFSQKKFGLMFVCVILLLFDVYIGFRSSFAMVLISLVVLGFSVKGKSRMILENKVLVLFSMAGALFIFVYKSIYLAVKGGAWGSIAGRFTSSDLYVESVLYSEPFTTQVILNEVIRTNFHISGDHFVGLLNNLLLFSPSIGLKAESFNSKFQPMLFAYHDAGMANNIWAEMWSVGGWMLLSVFIIMFVGVLFFGSYLLRISNPVIKGGVALFFSYWAFYTHRNDIAYQVVLEKRVFLVWLACIVLSYLVVLWGRTLKNKKLSYVNRKGW